jgi:hypothetical protein
MLRARQAQEDVAAQRTASAYRDSELALEAVSREQDRVSDMSTNDTESAQAFLASAAARQAAAATHSAAVHRAAFAQQRLQASIGELASAARERRTVEKLSERVLAERRAEAIQQAQREMDDQTASRHGRSTKRMSG